MLFSIAAITLVIGSIVIETQLFQQQTQKTVLQVLPNIMTQNEIISGATADDLAETTIIKKADEKVTNLIRISNFPVAEGYLSSPFGVRKDPINGNRRMHDGIDIAANVGTKVFPMGSGKIIFAGHKSGYGNTIEIQHGQSVITRYSHLKEVIASVDQNVTKHDLIGLVGSTGRSTGPHLHLEVVLANEKVDPQTFLAGQIAATSKPELESFEQTRLANVSYEDFVENLDGLYGLRMQ